MMRCAIVILVAILLHGCAEGGIGGTGGITGTPPIDMGGQGNKGPFANGAQVRVATVSGTTVSESSSTGVLGEYVVSVPEGEVRQITVTGAYFSETLGAVIDSDITLSGVVIGASGRHANVNVATDIAHRRVAELTESGMAADVAIEMAESELILALSPVLPAPVNPLDFNELVLINAAQQDGNQEGNAWLLALSAVLEQAAVDRAVANGTSVQSELTTLLTELSTGFASEGTIDSATTDVLTTARGRVDANVVHNNLVHLEQAFLNDALVESTGITATAASTLTCVVLGSEIKCVEPATGVTVTPQSTFGQTADGTDSDTLVSFDLTTVVADLNQFLDTDGDGIVNADDDDDDNDGTPDIEDDTPFGR